MCLIIHRPAGQEIPAELLKDAHTENADGWGIMTAKDGLLWTQRGFGLKRLRKALNKLTPNREECCIHFRWATHGTVNLDNCHPFPVGQGIAMMHNGIFSDVPCDIDKTKSDTWHFAQKLLHDFGDLYHWLEDEHVWTDLERMTRGSRVCFMRADGTVRRAHNWNWTEYKGLHLSNDNTLWRNGYEDYDIGYKYYSQSYWRTGGWNSANKYDSLQYSNTTGSKVTDSIDAGEVVWDVSEDRYVTQAELDDEAEITQEKRKFHAHRMILDEWELECANCGVDCESDEGGEVLQHLIDFYEKDGIELK